jgi:hypothetical protein
VARDAAVAGGVAILRGCRQSHVEAMQMWLATAKRAGLRGGL